MGYPGKIRDLAALVLSTSIAPLPALALVTLNDGRDHFFITGSTTMVYDSNIFANNGGKGDYIYSAGLVLEYARHAGWIGFNGSVALDSSRFGKYQSENFNNPKFTGEFTKATGRTTGSLTIGAARESRADSAANLRDASWNYSVGLNFKYPVIERYSISGSLDYTARIFQDNALLTNLKTYSAGVNLAYVFSADRDLIAGYRVRYGETSANSSYYDHAFNVGIAGKIIPRVNGSITVGYQLRNPHGATHESDFTGLNTAGTASIKLGRKMSLSGQISKDFTTTATNIYVDSTAANLGLSYALSRKISAGTGFGGGNSRFLGSLGAGRHDIFFTWSASLSYNLSEHFKSALAYVYFENWSTLNYADFIRHTATLSLSSRW